MRPELNTTFEPFLQDSFLILSDHVTQILKWVILTGLCQVINIFGVVTNVINITCFVKQGFKDPVNICLLAVSPGELPFDPMDVNYLVYFMPHLAFSRVTSWITAIITLERCLCIVYPLRIKSMVTHTRMASIVVVVFILLFASGCPAYAVNRLDFRFNPHKNKTILCLVYLEGKEIVEQVLFAVNNFMIPSVAFVLIVVCTVILVFKLHSNTKWRQKTSHVATDVSSRNLKVAKMVTMISILFISCFVPLCVVMLALSCEPQLSLNGRYLNLGIVLASLCFVLESVNSSVNIFIYYNMSTKYRDTFQLIFSHNKEENGHWKIWAVESKYQAPV